MYENDLHSKTSFIKFEELAPAPPYEEGVANMLDVSWMGTYLSNN